MIEKVENILLRKRLKKRSMKLKKQNERIRVREYENRILKNNIRHTSQELQEFKNSLTTGFCPYCEQEHLFLWDEKWGVMSFCPRCGARVMLCHLCERERSGCDYDERIDSCSEM